MNDIDPPKKSKLAESWKSITENLFGVQFDGQENLDEIDIDSVADVVEQLNPVEEAEAEQAKEEAQTPQDEPVSISEDELSFDEEETEEEAVAFEEADEPNDEPEEAGQTEPVSVDAELSDEDDSVDEDRSARATEKAFSRASFDDEDPFGFGIDDLDDDDIDDDTAESSEPTASVLKEEVEIEESLEVEDAGDAFDFEADEEKSEEAASERKSQYKKRGSGKAGRKKPVESAQLDEDEPEDVTSGKTVRQTADDDDGFWDSLKGWDGDDSRPVREDKRRGSSRRSRERQKTEAPEETDFVAGEVESQEEAERESRPRRARRRRRRSSRSRKNEPATQSDSSREEKEIAPEDIDRLWEAEDDEEVLSVPADTSSDEAPSDDSGRETSGEGKKRRRKRSSRSSGNRSDSGNQSGVAAETDLESSEQKREQAQSRQAYKNIPTWVEAIEMIVRRRDSDPNKGRSRGGGSGRRGRARSSSKKRPSRRRED